MNENLEKKLVLLDFLNIDYFLHTDDKYYYGEEFDYNKDAIIEEVENYEQWYNLDCPECNDYLVLDYVEVEKRFDQYMDNYIDDCVLSEIPEIYHQYFNCDKFKDHCDRGQILASYDGLEIEKNGYYIYKIN